MNLYARLATVKSDLKISGTSEDAALLRLLEAISRAIDNQCKVHFYSQIATRFLDGNGQRSLWLNQDNDNDLLSITTFLVDWNGDGVYETTLIPQTDYWLWPANELPKQRADLNPYGSHFLVFPAGRLRVQIQGIFGYSNETELTGATLNAGCAAGDTSVVLTAGGGALVGVGETLVMDSEQVDVTGLSTDTLTLTRGINGTTAVSHLISAPVSRRRYPREVELATTMQATRFLREMQTGYSGTVGSSGEGGYMFSHLYPAIRDLLAPFQEYVLA